MESMKNLLEPNCEGFNPISNLYTHINQAQTLQRNVFLEPNKDNNFVSDFFSELKENHAPTTFKMQSLILEINNASQKQREDYQLTAPNNWLSEFKPDTLNINWVEEYDIDSINHLEDKIGRNDWMNEYFNQPSQIELIDNKSNISPSAWLSEFENKNPITSNSPAPKEMQSNLLADEFKTSEENDFLQMFKDEWGNFDTFHPWTTDFENFKTEDLYKEYKFEENNPLLNEQDVLNEGLKRLRDGDIANAVLYFEAAVKQDSNNSEAWMHLGSTQADNEMEANAIAALNKCLELDPTNLAAIMSLAVSYTNEMMPLKACDLLKRWLLTNPLYKDLHVDALQADDSVFKSHSYIRDLFMTAVQRDPTNIDADLQIGLGVLFNLSGDYDKAVDCFKTALQVRPKDNLLWNKLGATLANGHRSEEAIDAYRRSLAISSGYVRTRYNLGIACINLQAYRESIEHFISALELQRNSRGPNLASGLMSENIWSSLKMAVSLLGRSDLMQTCSDRNLDFLKSEFHIKNDDI